MSRKEPYRSHYHMTSALGKSATYTPHAMLWGTVAAGETPAPPFAERGMRGLTAIPADRDSDQG